jgi:hypothetical protein
VGLRREREKPMHTMPLINMASEINILKEMAFNERCEVGSSMC